MRKPLNVTRLVERQIAFDGTTSLYEAVTVCVQWGVGEGVIGKKTHKIINAED